MKWTMFNNQYYSDFMKKSYSSAKNPMRPIKNSAQT